MVAVSVCPCTGGGAGVKDAPSKKGKAPPPEAEEEEGETFYDAMKKEMGGRLARTRAALDALDDEQRLVMEGHRPGVYLRLSFTGAADRPGRYAIMDVLLV